MVFHFNIPSFPGIELFWGIAAIIFGGVGSKSCKTKLDLISKFTFKLPPPFLKDYNGIISLWIADIRHGDW